MLQAEVNEVAGWLALFVPPGQATELRAIRSLVKERRCTQAGFFDGEHLAEMAQAALALTAEGVYFIANPVSPELLKRRPYKVQVAGDKQLTHDRDIVRRRWFFVDADPRRPRADSSSTDEEKAHAHGAILKAKELLLGKAGIGRLVLADSGNGYHLGCRVDLPVEDYGFVESTLRALGMALDTPHVKIDGKLFNPSRIIKLYGTWARKGESTHDRPHRRSRVLEVFDPWPTA